ncbi:MAG: FAD-binding protein [Candidatus Lokiarchaeota archaeon]|nr:FAD-binding protein [Candidatus Lokiarchaeota archaeon]
MGNENSRLDLSRIYDIFDENEVLLNKKELYQRYIEPFQNKDFKNPVLAIYPKTSDQISSLFKDINNINDVNVVIISSTTNPKFLDDTVCSENSIILDLRNMKQIQFIDRRNRVCVIEPGVTWDELRKKLKEKGMRPLFPLFPRKGKSALASILDREPHLIPKRQFDISDPLLCMEVVFGNGEIFRTGEAAGPHSIEKNREYGAALTNPLGPAQTDIFRIIQGSKGTLGCVTWISMQCDLIPSKREIKLIESNNVNQLNEFIYTSVRRRLVDEVFILNKNLFCSLFPQKKIQVKDYVLIFSVNGYEILPDQKVKYQLADLQDIMTEMDLEAKENISGISKNNLTPFLDGNIIEPHPKYINNMISVDLFYNTTLNRVNKHIKRAYEIISNHQFPREKVNLYLQPIIQARAVNVEFSLMVDISESSHSKSNRKDARKILTELADYISQNGGFFSRSYKLINEFAFTDRNKGVQDSLRKIKEIFDPNYILNKGQLIF